MKSASKLARHQNSIKHRKHGVAGDNGETVTNMGMMFIIGRRRISEENENISARNEAAAAVYLLLTA